MAKTPVQFRLNGADKAVFVDGGENLLNALRRGVGDMSAKFGCGQGTCGVCTVLVDGESQLACLTLAETCAALLLVELSKVRPILESPSLKLLGMSSVKEIRSTKPLAMRSSNTSRRGKRPAALV